MNIGNIAALTGLIVIPAVLALGWNKHYVAAWLVLAAYAAALLGAWWQGRKRG
jgi:uncharacterized membrane protein